MAKAAANALGNSRESLAAPAATPFLIATTAGIKRVTQVERIRRIHSQTGSFDILGLEQIYLVREHVTERDQSVEVVQKLRFIHFLNPLEQHLAVSGHTAESNRFQDRDLTAAQLDLPLHDETFTMTRFYVESRFCASS